MCDRYTFTLVVSNDKSQSSTNCSLTVKLGETPAITIIRRKGSESSLVHPCKPFVAMGKLTKNIQIMALWDFCLLNK